MEVSLRLNKKFRVSLKVGWLFTLCYWEAAIHTDEQSWKKMDIKLMMMMIIFIYYFNYYFTLLF